MKKLIAFVTALSCLSPSISAQNTYYYYRGSKIPLIEDTTKIVSIAPKSENMTLSPSNGFTLVNIIPDDDAQIKVYELDSSTTIKLAISAYSSSMCILPCYKSDKRVPLIPNGYINVKLKSADDYPILQSVAQQLGCEIIEQNTFMPLWYILRMKATSDRNPVYIANAIYETGKFAFSFPDFSYNAIEFSYDPDVYRQWGLYNPDYEEIDISLSQAWSYATGRGIKVAIIDCGIDLTHQDLIDNIYPLSYDTETKTSPSKVYGDHGTHCAGIVAAVRNNGIQVVGVAPDAKLMSVSTILKLKPGLESKLANGINWAWKNGADVISCSWWCRKCELVEEAINGAVTKGRGGKGCVFVKSAGNVSEDYPTYDISYPGDYSADVLAISNMTKKWQHCIRFVLWSQSICHRSRNGYMVHCTK